MATTTNLLLTDLMSGVSDASSIPLIDLKDLHGPTHSDIIKQIGLACQTDGFFEVKNHGVPEIMIKDMLNIAREFFQLPESERLKMYSDDPSKTNRLSTSFNVRTEKLSNWRDFLRLHCYPLQDYVQEWPNNPPLFREQVGEYCTNVRGLVLRLLEAISESLGLEKNCIVKALGKQGQHMALNYYPPCPQPELTYGLPGHTDANLITVLLQDEVPGLQVLRNGKWVAVNPIPNTFIVNIGDMMQVISNNRYKSVLHRAVVNCNSERISIPTFYCPSPDAVIGPAKELINYDHPAMYRNFTYAEYYEKFWNKGLATECCLDLTPKQGKKLLKMSTINREKEVDSQYAMQLANVSALPMVLKAATGLGVLDIIHRAGAGALFSPSQIASQLLTLHNLDATSVLDGMLRLLSAYSVLTCSTIQANGKVIRVYGLAPVSKYHLKDAVLEGGLPFSKAYGMNVVDYIGRDDRLGGVFKDSMKVFNLIFKKEILEIYTGFEGLRTLVDVGGGDGTILNRIIPKHPAIKGINYDLPLVVKKSPFYPVCFALLTYRGVLLHNCYKALLDNGKVIVVDMVIQEAPKTSLSAKSLSLFDVYRMNTNVSGNERIERELQSLAKAARFSEIRVACISFTFSVVKLLKNM
ncbi:hypothetical protein DVH24_039935 [Malus domestica]|uniref:Fe2OG dioxygenase domain-containing protein n=1 Tax=Malus domestica TaxID=3750 RepID=A0A498I705_MALDO|nr:hypothetical protein DVH24_039935 [Malus domestica]